MLAAWLAVYAVGSLVQISDGGLRFRAINRFIAFKTGLDCNPDRTFLSRYAPDLSRAGGGSRHYAAARYAICFAIRGAGISDDSETSMRLYRDDGGNVLCLPSGLVSGLYRARGFYGGAVRLQNRSVLIGQLAQLVAIMVVKTPPAVAIAYAAGANTHRVLFSGDRCSGPVSTQRLCAGVDV